jgi:hypothetical protein
VVLNLAHGVGDLDEAARALPLDDKPETSEVHHAVYLGGRDLRREPSMARLPIKKLGEPGCDQLQGLTLVGKVHV